MSVDARTGPAALNAASTPYDQLFAALSRLDQLLEAACNAAEKTYGAATDRDPYRAFYVSPQDFRQLLGRPAGAPLLYAARDEAGSPTPLAAIQRAFGLSAFDVDVLTIALAPEIDLRYQRLMAYLQDDVTRKRPSVDLALNLLCPTSSAKLAARHRFAVDAPLIRHRLVQLAPSASGNGPFLARELELDDGVVAALIGEPVIDKRIHSIVTIDRPGQAGGHAFIDALGRLAQDRIANGRPALFHFRGPRHAGQLPAARDLASMLGKSLLTADCRLPNGANVDLSTAGSLLIRDARLHDAVLCVDGLDSLRTTELQPKLASLLASLRHRLDLVIVVSDTPWAVLHEAATPDGDVIALDFSLPGFTERLDSWHAALGPHAAALDGAAESLAGRFRLTIGQIRAAAASAVNQARLRAASRGDDVAPTVDDLFTAARGQSTHRLGTLARQITPRYTLHDLVLPDDSIAQLREVCNQVRQRHVVYDGWGFDRKLSLGKGINVLFSGPPGAGKTMAAEVFAHELGLDLFKIDLSQIVSKYIGETEKNLNRVFDEAKASNAILFFDEADALFGKRSEVRDSHDRYANIEIAYLLQKMEEYEGLSVLATNLKQNLDEAFTRRLSFIIDFPFPDDESRLRIWRSMWPNAAPISDDVDLGYMARTFRLSGGSIKNVAVAAAFLAAEQQDSIRTSYLVRATRREFQKMGKSAPNVEPDGYGPPALAS